MSTSHLRLEQAAERATVTWVPVKGGKRSWLCFVDDKTYDLGTDSSGARFNVIATRMLSGDYYPRDAVVFSGRFKRESRDLRVGDRVVQQAPLFGKFGGPLMSSSAEIYVAERELTRCTIGYVTTSAHFAKGIWTAELSSKKHRLCLRVWSTASPNSWQFWLGLPYARFLQLRARRRAVQEFGRVPEREIHG